MMNASFNSFFTRTNELNALLKFYDDHKESTAVAIITGDEGRGKTRLIREFTQGVSDHTLVLEGNSNSLNKHIPYYSFRCILSDYIKFLLNVLDKHEIEELSFALKKELGVALLQITDYVPEVALLLNDWTEVPDKEGYKKISNQLPHLFMLLVEQLLSFSSRRVVMVYDDLQYVDKASFYVLNYILQHSSQSNLFVLISYPVHSQEVLGDEIQSILNDLEWSRLMISKLVLKPLGFEDISEVAQEYLEGYCSRELKEFVFEESEGNITRLLSVLEKLKLNNCLWKQDEVWQTDRYAVKTLLKQEQYHSVTELQMRRLSLQGRRLLYFVSCLGEGNKTFIQGVLEMAEEDLQIGLKECIEYQLLFVSNEGVYTFKDNQQREEVYRKVPVEIKYYFHFLIGTCFMQEANLTGQQKNVSWLMQAVDHLNHAGDYVTDIIELVRLNLQVGKIAQENADYESATMHFNRGLLLLEKEVVPLKILIPLKSELTLRKAECDYFLEDFDLAEVTLDELLESPVALRERMQAYRFKVLINTHIGRLKKAFEILKIALTELGVDVSEWGEQEVKEEVQKEEQKLQEVIDHIGLEGLLKKQPDREQTEEEILLLELLYVGGIAINYASETLMIWQSLRIINLGVETGLNQYTALALVTYGRMLIGVYQHLEKGYTFGELGLSLHYELQDLSLRTRVSGVFSFFIHFWKKPLKEVIPVLREGVEIGLKAGDPYGSFVLQTHLVNCRFIAGESLKKLQDDIYQLTDTRFKNFTSYILDYHRELLLALTGENLSFALGESTQVEVNAFAHEEAFYRYYVTGKYAFFFGYFEDAMHAFTQARMSWFLHKSSPLYSETLYYYALSVMLNFQNIEPEERKHYLDEIQDLIDQFVLWQQSSPENFQHKCTLLYAEYQRVTGRAGDGEMYQKALEEVESTPYIQDKALIHILLMRYYVVGRGVVTEATDQFRKAIHALKKWGAKAVEKQLHNQYRYLHDGMVSTMATYASIGELQLHFTDKVSMGAIVKRLLILAMKQTGADKATLILEEQGQLKVLGKGNALDFSIRYYEDPKFIKDTELEFSVILYAYRKKEVVNLTPESNHSLHLLHNRNTDVRSMLCVPVSMPNGRNIIFSLESSLVSNVFTSENIKKFNMLASQAAMNMYNALVHQQTVQLNEQLRQEVKEKAMLNEFIEEQRIQHIGQINETQEAERKRIAQDLHDSIGGMLSSVRMRFKDFSKDITEERQQQYLQVVGMLDQTFQEVRRISHNMMPGALIKFGLDSALQDYLEDLQIASELDVSYHVWGNDEENRLPAKMEMNLFRICQEITQNVIKHAKASKLSVQLMYHEESLNIIIEDNGVGFDTSLEYKGIGIDNIMSRVKFLGGEVTIDSFLQKGTTFLLDIPITKLNKQESYEYN
ncbi:AAA family ATPase [Algivirga pacifica]|uniref:Histidine kinase domain-containing protein n=1 Tax=Algivirga pacifica TaxID=1162670 RepID=A0ABP9D8P1_9BACT